MTLGTPALCRVLPLKDTWRQCAPAGYSYSTSMPPASLSAPGSWTLPLDHSSGSPLPNGPSVHSYDTAAAAPCLVWLPLVLIFLLQSDLELVQSHQQAYPPRPQSWVSAHKPTLWLQLGVS